MPASSPSPTCQGVSSFGKKFLYGVVALAVIVFVLCLLASWERLPKSLPASASEPKCEPKKEEKKKEEPCVEAEQPKKAEPAKFDESKWPKYNLHDNFNFIYLKPGEWSPIIYCPPFRLWEVDVVRERNPRPLNSLTYYFPGDDYRVSWRPGEYLDFGTASHRHHFMLLSPQGGWVAIKLKNY